MQEDNSGFVLNALKAFIQWAHNLIDEGLVVILELLEPLISMIGEQIPSEWVQYSAEVFGWIGAVNAWFPVVYAAGALGGYYTLKLMLNVVKWTFKAIPTFWG